MSTHLCIPDTQVKPGVPVDHLKWIGQYIIDRFAGVEDVSLIHLGDHWDMPSLSSYDKGTRSMEGRRVVADIEAGNAAFALLNQPLEDYNNKRKQFKEKQWSPRRILIRGNHEDRITRAIEYDASLEGFLSLDLLQSPGWEVVPYLRSIKLDGVQYCHYFANPMTGKPYGGSAEARLKTIGTSFVMGHQQVLQYAERYVNGQSQHAIIAGANYLQNESYKGPQGNAHWRGILVLTNVENGSFDAQFISLDALCRVYEGKPVAEFLKDKYNINYMEVGE